MTTTAHNCPFCGIVRGSRTADVLARFEGFVVFRPLSAKPGKVLIVPTEHVETLVAMDIATRGRLIDVVVAVGELLRARSFRLQISCGARAQYVRHIYVQYVYSTEAWS
jgi:diadenosine tetraphosphate (Ap4A) HIT family hydrolase